MLFDNIRNIDLHVAISRQNTASMKAVVQKKNYKIKSQMYARKYNVPLYAGH